MLYSRTLKPYEGRLPVEIQAAVQEISQYFGIPHPEVLTLDEWNVVVPVVYPVSLPSRGAVGGIAIGSEEPMLIRLNLKYYPHAAPLILSDRKDFPRERLSHLYLTPVAEPARLCLVRTNPHEWFATIKLSDFLDVGGLWLYKAATGQLNEDGDEFDPTRPEGNVHSHHIYRYDLLNEAVINNYRFFPELPMALFAGAQLLEAGTFSAYHTNAPVPLIAFKKVQDALVKAARKGRTKRETNPVFTFLFWDAKGETDDFYLTARPENYGQLKVFFRQRGINLHQALIKLNRLNTILKRGLSIIFAVKRPRKVTGYNGQHEFINFLITLPPGGIVAADNQMNVAIQDHIEPFSAQMATHLSARELTPPTLYIGAGSLGSKLILHDARSGNVQIGICDNDTMLPHNLARHVLVADQVGHNKAAALAALIEQFYAADNPSKMVAFETSAINLDREFQAYQQVIDTTASVQVMNFLLSKKLPATIRYYKAEIADAGALGLFYAEGPNRNPRMDDLVNLACFYATKKEFLQKWRMNDAGREITSLNVGLGCQSTTSVLADDTLDFHASVFSRILAKANTQTDHTKTGLLALSSLDETNGFPRTSTEYINVPAFEVLTCQAGSGWEVRLIGGLKEQLLSYGQRRAPNETGGVLVGVANYKTKAIHIFDCIAEPQGSHGTCGGFVRGTTGLPLEIDAIKQKTGDVIGYVGEWHTHPMNLKRLSTRDQETIAKLTDLNRLTPIPTCALIATLDELLVYVYE